MRRTKTFATLVESTRFENWLLFAGKQLETAELFPTTPAGGWSTATQVASQPHCYNCTTQPYFLRLYFIVGAIQYILFSLLYAA
jgi:hypothetical protein